LKAETTKKILFMRLLLGWREAVKKVGAKKISKYVIMYMVYLSIVLSFDWVYMPWLAIKFRYWTFFPLYFSLFIVCLLSLFIYDFFNEDMFFKEKIQEWFARESKYKFTRVLKRKIISNPRAIFVAIAIWWSPLHAYIYFREGNKNYFSKVVKTLGKGSLYCAFFWSVIVGALIALWDLVKLMIKLFF